MALLPHNLNISSPTPTLLYTIKIQSHDSQNIFQTTLNNSTIFTTKVKK